MSVQRWKPRKATQRFWSEGMTFDADGAFVTYADHVADKAAGMELAAHAGYQQALREAREAVAALPWEVAISFGPIDCDYSCEDGPCTCSGVMRPEGWTTGPGDVLAAIDALGEQT